MGESILFQPVSKTYPTCHSWIITAHISLGHLECHWKYFNRQLDKTHQLLISLTHQPAARSCLLSPPQVELTTISDMYNSCKSKIISAINFLNTDPSFDGHTHSNTHHKRSLTGTATTKDINSIKTHVNQLIETQSVQQETLVHIISILNVTRCAAQINRHNTKALMDIMDDTSQDVNNLYHITTSLATSLSYYQIILYIRSVLANLRDSLSYIIKVSMHTMDYIDAASTGRLSPHILPIMDLRKMLSHIEDTLPSTLHLPVSSEDTLHFYCYLHTHVLIANKQFLLLIHVPVQDRSQQLTICRIFTLGSPHGNFTVHYDINTEYLGIAQGEIMAMEISPQQFRICQEANGQFCTIPTLFQPLANPPFCITALYVKNTASISGSCSLQIMKSSDVSMPSQLTPNDWILITAPSEATGTITLIFPGETTQFIKLKRPIHILCLPTACSATSPSFHLHPHYEGPPLEVNISLDMTNLNMINISSVNFCIWQHLEKHQNESQLLHLASIPSVPFGQLNHHMAKGFECITPFSP